ncbi:MAG: hypothetical protein KFH87_11245 [Bacteroidetes bacterium]|nr:hypothetical protein [Bacteroidota bacterium]
MTVGTLITMALILGLVWGGFAGLLLYAIRRETKRSPMQEEHKTTTERK